MANLNIAIEILAKDQASGAISKIGKSVGSLTTLVGGALVAGAAAGGAALIGVGAAAFGVSNEIDVATGNIQAQLGTTAEEAERLGDIPADVWGTNFAGNITEAASCA